MSVSVVAHVHACKVPKEGVALKQTVFDLDSWISRSFPLLLCNEKYKYHCLSDYNFEIIEVNYLDVYSGVNSII